MGIQGKISCLSSWTKPEEIRSYCEEAKLYGYQYVTVLPFYVPLAKAYLKGSSVMVNAFIDYPLGQSSAKGKAYTAADAVKRGADLLTIFPNLAAIKMGDLTFLKGEASLIRSSCPHTQIIYLMASSFSPVEGTKIRSALSGLSIGLDFSGELTDPIPTKKPPLSGK